MGTAHNTAHRAVAADGPLHAPHPRPPALTLLPLCELVHEHVDQHYRLSHPHNQQRLPANHRLHDARDGRRRQDCQESRGEGGTGGEMTDDVLVCLRSCHVPAAHAVCCAATSVSAEQRRAGAMALIDRLMADGAPPGPHRAPPTGCRLSRCTAAPQRPGLGWRWHRRCRSRRQGSFTGSGSGGGPAKGVGRSQWWRRRQPWLAVWRQLPARPYQPAHRSTPPRALQSLA